MKIAETMKKGDVCLINLSLGVGYEQYGERPVSQKEIDEILKQMLGL